MSFFRRLLMQGTRHDGDPIDLAATQEGHLEVALHAPRLPFGSVHVENLTPVFQCDAVYGLNTGLVTTGTSLSGSVDVNDGSFRVQSGTTAFAQAQIQGRKRLRYRAGQGVVGRFAGKFTAGVANSYQVAGFGHAEDGYFFGYVGTQFGVLRSHRGVREVRTLTITTGATGAGNVTVTLNGTAYTIFCSGTGATAGERIQRTVYELGSGTYAGWKAYPQGATIVYVRDSAGAASGSYSVSGGAVVGSFASTKAGVAATEVFVPQSSWNGDTLDGSGASGVTLDPTKGNVYQINIQYLGYGDVVCKLEIGTSGNNNADFIDAHTFKFPNTLTGTHIGNPSFPFTMAVYSAGSTTNLSIEVGSFAGFIEGIKVLHGNRFTYYNQLATVGATNLQALFTIQNKRYYGGRTNQAVVNMLNASGAIKHTSPVVYYLIKNGTLDGYPNFQDLATNSCTSFDTSATTVTYTSGDQLLATFHVGDTGAFDHHFGNGTYNAEEIELQPGEWVTLAARAVTGTPSYVTGSINTREDQ